MGRECKQKPVCKTPALKEKEAEAADRFQAMQHQKHLNRSSEFVGANGKHADWGHLCLI